MYSAEREAYIYQIREQPVNGYAHSYAGPHNEQITNTLHIDIPVSSLTVYLCLFDVNGALVDEDHPDYGLHNEPFTIRLTDATDPELAPIVTELSVPRDGYVQFPIRDARNTAGVTVELAPDQIPVGYSFYEKLSIYWDGAGQGVTTIIARVNGKGIPIDDDDYVIYFYITYHGRLYKPEMAATIGDEWDDEKAGFSCGGFNDEPYDAEPVGDAEAEEGPDSDVDGVGAVGGVSAVGCESGGLDNDEGCAGDSDTGDVMDGADGFDAGDVMDGVDSLSAGDSAADADSLDAVVSDASDDGEADPVDALAPAPELPEFIIPEPEEFLIADE
jgi:hypothetical protein